MIIGLATQRWRLDIVSHLESQRSSLAEAGKWIGIFERLLVFTFIITNQFAGIGFLIVPYKGSAPAYQDLVGGSIDAFIDPILGSSSFAKAGQLKVLAITSKNRVPSQPEMPTVAETVPGYEFYSWYGLWGPASLPKEIATRLNAEVNKALGSDMREKLEPQGLLLTPGSIDDFVHFQKDDMAMSQRIITEGKIRAE